MSFNNFWGNAFSTVAKGLELEHGPETGDRSVLLPDRDKKETLFLNFA
jgi:hypothetical protein